MSLRMPRARVIATVVASALALAAIIIPASASAAGPFKSVAVAGFSPTQMKLSGGLDVAKRCLAKRTIEIYGANLAVTFQNLPKLTTATSGKSGSWSRNVPARDHFVLILKAKRVGGKLCAGGAMLVEAGGPT